MSGRRHPAAHRATPVGGIDPGMAAPEGNPPMMPPPPPPPNWQAPQEFIPQEEESRVVGELDGEEQLSPEEQLMFSSLLTCGRRSKTITLYDHTVVVQTLCADDDLRIGLYAKEYVGTLGEQRAYQVGVAAAGMRSIDGKPFVEGLFEQRDEDALFDEKVKLVAKMYPTVINRIYRAVMEAEKEFVELTERLGKSDG